MTVEDSYPLDDLPVKAEHISPEPLKDTENDPALIRPPSFAESQFHVILRRQRQRHLPPPGLKLTETPSRFINLSNDFEFAGWGSVSYLELSDKEVKDGEAQIKRDNERPLMGAWMASAVAANEVFGSVFYAFPAVVAVSGVYSPISLLFSTLSLFLWRPIIAELTSAIPKSGSNYTYLINSASKATALTGGAIALLDYCTTVSVSAATASTYISGESVGQYPIPSFPSALLIMVVPTCITLLGIRESARVAFGILTFHMSTMVAICLAAIVAWARAGNAQLQANWTAGNAIDDSAASILKQIYYGTCIGMVGLTGFECSPDYVPLVRYGQFPRVLRNIHLPALALYAPLILFVFAVLPLETILGGKNVLSALAEASGGRWLRIWVVVDASVVLSAGVLTGILSACALLEQLSRDRIVPAFFLYRLPRTDAFAVSIIGSVLLSAALFGTTGARLDVISKMFAMTWLTVMATFPFSLLMLKFNRGRIYRETRAPLPLVIFTLLVSAVVFAGNIAVDPTTVGYFSAYAVAILLFFFASANRVRLVRWLYWTYDQTDILHKWRWLNRRGKALVKIFRKLRRQQVCVCAKSDEIHHLFRMIQYVAKNEETSCIKLVHFYDRIDDIPSELEANAKLLDEAFPEITVDLIFVQAPFTAPVIAALSQKLQIPRSLMFMSCPGPGFRGSFVELGMRIISL